MKTNKISAPVSKIPGTSAAKEQHVKPLKLLMYHELLDMKERQSHLLASKKRLQMLPDKGKRVQESYDKLLLEIQRRNDVDATADLFGDMNITSKGKVKLNNLEWHGHTADPTTDLDDVLDSDDEQEMDPLRVIAQATMHQRQIRVLPPPATLITDGDLEDIASFRQTPNSLDSTMSASSSFSGGQEITVPTEIIEIDVATLVGKRCPKVAVDQHTLYLIDKIEPQKMAKVREKFLPFRTTTTGVHDPDMERTRKQGKHWENTAATPPLIQHKEMQLVPLAESASLQLDYMQKVKELRIQQAEERLARQTTIERGIFLPPTSVLKTKASFQSYRNPQVDHLIEGRRHVGEENEVLDQASAEVASTGVRYSEFD